MSPASTRVGSLWFFVMKEMFKAVGDIHIRSGEEGQMQHFPDGYRQSSFVSSEIARVFVRASSPRSRIT